MSEASDTVTGALRQMLAEANDKIAALTEEVGMLKAQRLLDNDDLARAYDMGRDKERAAVVVYLRDWPTPGDFVEAVARGLANDIERGEPRREEAR